MTLRWRRFWHKRSVTISEYDPSYKVIYLGNVLTPWAKGDGCVDKPLATLWKNYCANVKHQMWMKVTIGGSGLKALTKEHGLTEYWSNRVTHCGTHSQYPRLFFWIYRHEGRKLKQELRCHAVLCAREEKAQLMAAQLSQKLSAALQEFRREKLSRQRTRLSSANSRFLLEKPNSLPRRKQLLSTGYINFRPPLERSRSAPKLTAIEETLEERYLDAYSLEEEEDEDDLEDLMTASETTTSDHLPDDVDSLSDCLPSDSLDSDSVEETPNPRRTRHLNSIDEEEDSGSDESGYSEDLNTPGLAASL